MKRAFAAILAIAAFSAFAEDAETITMVNASLKDGSTVKGEFCAKTITGSTLFMEKLDLAPAMVKSLAFSGTNGESKVELSNGDRFAMTVADESFAIRSLIGELAIPRANFRSIAFSQRNTAKGEAGNGLMFHCTFEDEDSIRTPAAGPGGTFQGGDFTNGREGNALRVPAHTSCAKFKLPEGTIGTAGTIEFWARIDEVGPLTNGGCPRFFEILSLDRHAEISHDWNANNGSGGSGLTFRIDGLPAMSSLPPAGISSSVRPDHRLNFLQPPNGWHHYALVWDAKGIDAPGSYSAAVFFDGYRVLSSPFAPEWKGSPKLGGETTLFFPSREDEMPDYARRAYTIDEFKIWNFAKTDFGI